MTRVLAFAVLAGALLQAGPAAAQESLSVRAVSVLGHLIAQQGNQALRDIRDQMRERLQQDLKPVLPRPAPATPPPPRQQG